MPNIVGGQQQICGVLATEEAKSGVLPHRLNPVPTERSQQFLKLKKDWGKFERHDTSFDCRDQDTQFLGFWQF